MRFAAVVTALLMWSPLTPLRPTEQAASLSGTWTLTSPAASGETENGGTFSRTAISGTLELEQTGNSVTGRWRGPKGDPWQLTGKVQDGKFELRSESRKMPVVVDDATTNVSMHWRFRGAADGDKLTGTMALSRDDAEPNRMFPFTAARKR
jgi:hypothetical protein